MKTPAVNPAIASLQAELEQPDNFFLEKLWIWVADRVLHSVRYEQFIVDVGYDISAHAKATYSSK